MYGAVGGGRRVKVFKERNSLFDHLNEVNPYFEGVYSVCKTQLILFLICIFLRDSYRAGRPYLDLSKDGLVMGSLEDWLVFTGLELGQFLVFMLFFLVFQVWMKMRSWMGRLANFLFFLAFVLYLCGSFYVVVSVVYGMEVASIPRLVAIIEQIRFSMKYYSFVRENAYKVLYPWHKEDKSGPAVWYAGQMSPQVGSFSQYLYFLFAPTLLYRDHYPRNKGPVNWSNVLLYGAQFLAIYYLSKVMFLEVQFPKSFKIGDLMETYLSCLLASPLMYFLACLLVFNSWFNFTAELTRFADREFYLNWWAAGGFSEFYRLWNVPVYDFLSTYIYQDLYALLGSRALATLPVIIFSSVTHDFFTCVGMGFFFPVFIILFAILGGSLIVFRIKFTKTSTFMFLCLGYLLFQSFFYTEIAARYYCPGEELSQFEFRTFYCFDLYNA